MSTLWRGLPWRGPVGDAVDSRTARAVLPLFTLVAGEGLLSGTNSVVTLHAIVGHSKILKVIAGTHGTVNRRRLFACLLSCFRRVEQIRTVCYTSQRFAVRFSPSLLSGEGGFSDQAEPRRRWKPCNTTKHECCRLTKEPKQWNIPTLQQATLWWVKQETSWKRARFRRKRCVLTFGNQKWHPSRRHLVVEKMERLTRRVKRTCLHCARLGESIVHPKQTSIIQSQFIRYCSTAEARKKRTQIENQRWSFRIFRIRKQFHRTNQWMEY